MMYLLPFLENHCTYKSLKIKNAWFTFSSNFELLENTLAALRDTLFTFAAQKLGGRWLYSTKAQKIQWLLYGSPHIDFQTNVYLFKAVQSYIMQSARFTS